MMPGSRREVHAADEVLEARVRAQGIESSIGLEHYHPRLVPTKASLQTTKSFVLFAQGCVQPGHKIGCYVSLLRKLIQLLQDLARLVPMPSRRMGLPKGRHEPRSALGKLNTLLHCGDGKLRHRLI